MWTEERKKVERAIIELVRLYHQARGNHNNVAANAYEQAIRVVNREFNEPCQYCGTMLDMGKDGTTKRAMNAHKRACPNYEEGDY